MAGSATQERIEASAVTREYVTFYVSEMLLGIPIEEVEEINRLVDMTQVPHAPEYARGVINLRGEVVTVVDLQSLLDLPPASIGASSRNVIVRWQGQRIGMLVERVADVVRVRPEDMEPPPSNVGGASGQWFLGVHKLESQLLMILEVDRLLERESGQN